MSYSIKDLKDVSAGAAQKLAELGVTTTEQLLEKAGQPRAATGSPTRSAPRPPRC